MTFEWKISLRCKSNTCLKWLLDNYTVKTQKENPVSSWEVQEIALIGFKHNIFY